jgi:plastocyanin
LFIVSLLVSFLFEEVLQVKRSFSVLLILLVALNIVMIAAAFGPTQKVVAADPITISMSDFAYNPKEITIPVGSQVIFKNDGAKKHTATADDNSFNTDVIEPGASSAPITFDKAGTFPYFCEFHGGPGGVDMAAVITVADAAAAPAQAATEAPPAANPTAEAVGSVLYGHVGEGFAVNTITVNITALPILEEGKQYAAWLVSEKNTQPLGAIQLKADGTAKIDFAAPKGTNALELFNTVLITEQGTELTPPGKVIYSGQIPPQAYVHVKHVMSGFPETPEKIGLVPGALEQESVLSQHVTFLLDSIAKNNLPLAKRHLEHIHNIATGNDGAKDIDGNGKMEVVPPGDGFGIFKYLTTAVQHADLAAKTADASDNIKVKANQIKTTAANASTTLTQIQDLVVKAAATTKAADMKPLADQIAQLNDTVVKGVPDASGAVSPTKGSGGLGLTYTAGLSMASFLLLPGDVSGGKAGGSEAPAAATEPAAPAANADANVIKVIVTDFEFKEKNLTVPVGASVVFVNQGAKKHTATADDNSFDTGVIAPAAESAPIKFDKAGTFPYFCQFHGGPGGTAMAGVITVQ